MLNKKKIKNDSGFTLIEVIVALAITSMIMIMTYSAYHVITKSVWDLTEYTQFYEDVNLAILKIDKDITNIFYKRDDKKISLTGDIANNNSFINFVTVNYKRFNIQIDTKQEYPTSDIEEARYYLKESDDSSLFNLIKREDIFFDEEIETGGTNNILLKNVVSLKFQYRLRNNWSDRWDSRRSNKYPLAIKTTLIVKDYKNKDQKFVFVSIINVL